MSSIETLEVSGEITLKDKITAIKNLSKSLELRLRGYMYNTSNEKWNVVGFSLAGKDFINKVVGMVNSFSETANLITTKNEEKFFVQYADFFRRLNNLLLNDETITAENYRTIIKMCKDTMVNIGDIITGSRDFISKSMVNDIHNTNTQVGYE